jgi:hypothetical protein
MLTITEITKDEIITLLDSCGVTCNSLWFQGSKFCYLDGFLEGESKWALRYCVEIDEDTNYNNCESLGIFLDSQGRKCIPPHAALEYLAHMGRISPGEYLVWNSW